MDSRFSSDAKAAKKESHKKAYISIYWKCCHVFSRVHKNRQGSAYQGYCPRCRAPLVVPIGAGGTQQRTFIAE
jgi:hypothetical protein